MSLINQTLLAVQTWHIKITLDVADIWVEDGFDASEKLAQISDAIESMLPYAMQGSEVKAKVEIVKAPAKETLRKLQGW